MLPVPIMVSYNIILLLKNFQDREKFKLGNPKEYHFLNQSSCYVLDGIDDSEEYAATRRAMDVVGISDEEQVGVLRTQKFYDIV